MNSKYFRVTWRDGNVVYLKGLSIANALKNSGYDCRSISVISHYKEAPYLPMDKKEVIILNSDGTCKYEFQYNDDGLFPDTIRRRIGKVCPDIDGDLIEIEVMNKKYNYFIVISPLQIICRII